MLHATPRPVHTRPLFRLIKAEIISSTPEKELFLLGLSPRPFLRSNQDTGRKESSVSLGLTHVRGRENAPPSVPVCARWGVSTKNQSGSCTLSGAGGRPHGWAAQRKELKCPGTSKEGQLLPG